MRTTVSLQNLSAGLLAVCGLGFAGTLAFAQMAPSSPVYLDQGPQWTAARRATFYSEDQGSELIPIAWARALVGPDGSPLLGDGLARYGYLANPASPNGLPVGFTTDTDTAGVVHLGMTCAACHTREISASGQRYRIDGAPAISDFQQFLTDLSQSVSTTLMYPAAFDPFARTVLGPGASSKQIASLRAQVTLWDQTQGSFFRTVLPATPWGVGRLDAVSMIFDRVSGLDIGNTPQNAQQSEFLADAPVRYPFIWDAPKQDKTQWPGFAANGDNLMALNRNLGEVYGVFAYLKVKRTLFGDRFLKENSAKIDNLIDLEDLVNDIGAPKWPWSIDEAKRAKGQVIFDAQCSSCHGVKIVNGGLIPRRETWSTGIADVGTDSREYDVLGREAATGVLKGQLIPPLGETTKQFTLLKTVVVHSLLDQFHDHPESFVRLFPKSGAAALLPSNANPVAKTELLTAYDTDKAQVAGREEADKFKYEARVLHGIWAAAPYLHNGSVQSLAQLLTPDTQRLASFPIGPAFDPVAVGVSSTQLGPQKLRVTTGREARGSGNCHCGHNYGTMLQPDEKLALIEYLKTL